jgi:hypothetical protein
MYQTIGTLFDSPPGKTPRRVSHFMKPLPDPSLTIQAFTGPPGSLNQYGQTERSTSLVPDFRMHATGMALIGE